MLGACTWGHPNKLGVSSGLTTYTNSQDNRKHRTLYIYTVDQFQLYKYYIMHVCVCVCVCVCTRMCAYAHVFVCVHARVHVHMWVHPHVRVHVRVHAHVRVHVCVLSGRRCITREQDGGSCTFMAASCLH